MILVARASTLGGIVSPICFAVFRLITSSNLVGCPTGRSAGLAPLRIFVYVDRCPAITLEFVGGVGRQTAILDCTVALEHRRQPVLDGEFGDAWDETIDRAVTDRNHAAHARFDRSVKYCRQTGIRVA